MLVDRDGGAGTVEAMDVILDAWERVVDAVDRHRRGLAAAAAAVVVLGAAWAFWPRDPSREQRCATAVEVVTDRTAEPWSEAARDDVDAALGDIERFCDGSEVAEAAALVSVWLPLDEPQG